MPSVSAGLQQRALLDVSAGQRAARREGRHPQPAHQMVAACGRRGWRRGHPRKGHVVSVNGQVIIKVASMNISIVESIQMWQYAIILHLAVVCKCSRHVALSIQM